MFKTIIPNAIYNGVDISEIIIRLKTLSYNSIIEVVRTFMKFKICLNF
jgi:hypothetical protein